MKGCVNYQSLIVEFASGAAGEGDRQRLEQHMETCKPCSAEFARLQDVLAVTRQSQSDPGEAYWNGYYGRLMERMDAEKAPLGRPALPWSNVLNQLTGAFRAPRWALQLAVALVLVATGVFIGRSTFGPGGDRVVSEPILMGPSAIQQAALETRAHAYLNRSKTLLLGLVNFDLREDDPEALNVERRRQIAGDLVTESGFLQAELTSADQRRLKALVSDLEIILLQIANIESAYDVPEIEMVQNGVDRKAILFKIEVEEMSRFGDIVPEDRPADVSPSI